MVLGLSDEPTVEISVKADARIANLVRIIARQAAQAAEDEDGRPRFVAGAIGPTNRTASISPDVSNPGFRAVTFDESYNASGAQASFANSATTRS